MPTTVTATPTPQEVEFAKRAVQRGWVSSEQVRECFILDARGHRAPVSAALVQRGYLSEAAACQLLAELGPGAMNGGGVAPTGSLVKPVPSPSPTASNVPMRSGVQPGAPGGDPNQALAQAIRARALLSEDLLQGALSELARYHQAGHGSVSLAQVLVQRGLLSRELCASLLEAQRPAASQLSGSPYASGPHPPVNRALAACPACGVRGFSGQRCQACGAPLLVEPSPSPSPNPYASGPTPAASSAHQSGPSPYASGPTPTPHPMAPVIPPELAGVTRNSQSGLIQADPNPFFPAAQPSSNLGPAADSHPAPPVGFQVPGSGEFVGIGADVSGSFETCIAPDDPIALKMPTIRRSDGRYEIVFGPYDILGEIARGGMGIVYRARQRDLKREVALKVLRDGEAATERQIRRFRRETEAAARLQHPNIVAVHEVGCIEGFHFFTMDLIEGDPLDQRIKRGQRPALREALKTVKEVARAIHYAHDKKIVHRDLKPANILMDLDGQPKVTDFGLAKNVDHRSMLTKTGAVVGTPYYMPPEQARGDPDIDGRCDVYAMGVILYELVTGKLPFKGETTMEVYHKILEEDPIAPRVHDPKIPRDVEVIILKAMDKERPRRYATALDLAEDLERFLDGEPIKARPLSPIGRLIRRSRKNKLATAATLFTVLVLALFTNEIVTKITGLETFGYFASVNKRRRLLACRQEWDHFTGEVDNQLLNVRGSISSASSKIKDSEGESALEDLTQARRILASLPTLINDSSKYNGRARAGLYYLCLDSSLRARLFNAEGKPKDKPDIAGFLEEARARIADSDLLTDRPPAADDPFGDIDETVYLPCSEADVRAYLTFVATAAVDLGEGQPSPEAYRVDFPLPVKDLRDLLRDIERERGHAFRLRGTDFGYQRALEAYRAALGFDNRTEESAAIRLEIGKVLAAKGELDASLETFDKIARSAPRYLPVYLERGRIYARRSLFEKAIGDYSYVIKNDYAPIEAYLARGRTYMKVGQFALALKDFESVLDIKDDSLWGYLERGKAHMALGNFDEAKEDLKGCIEINASLPEAYTARAELLFRDGKLDMATKDYETALYRDKGHTPASLGWAAVLERQLRYDEAIKRYQEVTTSESKASDQLKARAHAALGRLYALRASPRDLQIEAQGDPARWRPELNKRRQAARDELDKALRLDDQLGEAYLTRGRLSLAEERYEDAAGDLERALKVEQAWLALSEQFAASSSKDPFLDDWDSGNRSETKRRQRQRAMIQGLLGMAHFKSGQKDRARQAFTAARKLTDKKSSLAALGLGFLDSDRKAFDRALQSMDDEGGEIALFFQKAAKARDQVEESRKVEHYIEAQQSLARVLFLNPWHSKAWFERARLERTWGRALNGAVSDVSRALETNRYLSEAYAFRGFLYARDLPVKPDAEWHKDAQSLRDFEAAIRDFSRVLELAAGVEERADAFFGRGLAKFRRLGDRADSNRARDALADLDTAIELSSGSKRSSPEMLRSRRRYHELRAEVYDRLGRSEDAIADRAAIARLEARAKELARKCLEDGKRQQDERKYNEAIKSLSLAIDFDAKLSEAFYNRGLCYVKVGNFVPGVIDFSRALELNPRFADQFYNKVFQVRYVVDLKRVMDELNKIVSERPNVSYVIFLRGFFYVAKSEFKEATEGDFDNGIRDFNRTLELNPGHVTAWTYRGLLHAKKGQFIDAHRDYDQALKLDPQSGISHYLKAQSYAMEVGEIKDKEGQSRLKQKVVDQLDKAFKVGFRGTDRIKKDKGFENMEGFKPFKKLLEGKR